MGTTVLRKWNRQKRNYDALMVPSDGTYLVYSGHMDTLCNCPHCMKEIAFGDGYTSMEVQTEMGAGYAVCKECYEKEQEREKAWKRQQEH